jgi:hypothetical protein
MELGPWNWLEIAKLLASLLVPVALAAVGVYIHRVTKRFEHLQWRSQKLIEKRLSVYDDLAPLLNELLCYFTYIGGWRDLDPPAVVALKRVVDKKIHLAAPLFSQDFFAACMEFQDLCFETYTGWGRDALLRTSFQRRREGRANDWRTEWDACFSAEIVDPESVRSAYRRVMEAFAADIGVHATSLVPLSGEPPANSC